MDKGLKIGLLVLSFLMCYGAGISQSNSKTKKKFYIDTLIVMDYSTGYASERLSQLRKPLNRKFYLKSGTMNYQLFQGNVAKMTTDQVLGLLDKGFNLYFDKMEYKDHQNMKPSTLEIIANNEVVETLESLESVKETELRRKLAPGKTIRLSGFIVSVNEEKLGPIMMDVSIVE